MDTPIEDNARIAQLLEDHIDGSRKASSRNIIECLGLAIKTESSKGRPIILNEKASALENEIGILAKELSKSILESYQKSAPKDYKGHFDAKLDELLRTFGPSIWEPNLPNKRQHLLRVNTDLYPHHLVYPVHHIHLKRILEAWTLGKAQTRMKNYPKSNSMGDEITLTSDIINVSSTSTSPMSIQRASSVGLEPSSYNPDAAAGSGNTSQDRSPLPNRHSTRSEVATVKAKSTMKQRKPPVAIMTWKPTPKQYARPGPAASDNSEDDDIPSCSTFPAMTGGSYKKRKGYGAVTGTNGTPRKRVHPSTPCINAEPHGIHQISRASILLSPPSDSVPFTAGTYFANSRAQNGSDSISAGSAHRPPSGNSADLFTFGSTANSGSPGHNLPVMDGQASSATTTELTSALTQSEIRDSARSRPVRSTAAAERSLINSNTMPQRSPVGQSGTADSLAGSIAQRVLPVMDNSAAVEHGGLDPSCQASRPGTLKSVRYSKSIVSRSPQQPIHRPANGRSRRGSAWSISSSTTSSSTPDQDMLGNGITSSSSPQPPAALAESPKFSQVVGRESSRNMLATTSTYLSPYCEAEAAIPPPEITQQPEVLDMLPRQDTPITSEHSQQRSVLAAGCSLQHGLQADPLNEISEEDRSPLIDAQPMEVDHEQVAQVAEQQTGSGENPCTSTSATISEVMVIEDMPQHETLEFLHLLCQVLGLDTEDARPTNAKAWEIEERLDSQLEGMWAARKKTLTRSQEPWNEAMPRLETTLELWIERRRQLRELERLVGMHVLEGSPSREYMKTRLRGYTFRGRISLAEKFIRFDTAWKAFRGRNASSNDSDLAEILSILVNNLCFDSDSFKDAVSQYNDKMGTWKSE